MSSSVHITHESNEHVCKVVEINEIITNFRNLLIVKQILLVTIRGNVKRTVWRIRIPILGCKVFKLDFDLF